MKNTDASDALTRLHPYWRDHLKTLVKIAADIILQRETQKGIVLGEGGKMIKQLGTEARKDIEKFLDRKVFLELFVKVRPKWRDNEIQLREYGY